MEHRLVDRRHVVVVDGLRRVGHLVIVAVRARREKIPSDPSSASSYSLASTGSIWGPALRPPHDATLERLAADSLGKSADGALHEQRKCPFGVRVICAIVCCRLTPELSCERTITIAP